MKQYTRLTPTKAELTQLKNLHGEIFVTISQTEEYTEAKWQGHITADDVIAAGKAYLTYIKKYPSPKLLNDKSGVTGDWEEAVNWLEFEWLPQAIDAGLCCFTHVYSADMFSQLSARDLYSRVAPSLQMKNFTDREHAISWLLACNTPVEKRVL